MHLTILHQLTSITVGSVGLFLHRSVAARAQFPHEKEPSHRLESFLAPPPWSESVVILPITIAGLNQNQTIQIELFDIV